MLLAARITNRFQAPRRAETAPDFFSEKVARTRRFYRCLVPSQIYPLAVVCGGLEHTAPDYAIRRDSFSFYSIEYVVGGHGKVKLNGRRSSLQAGRIFSYGPGVRQEIIGDPAEPLVKYFVVFTGVNALEQLGICHLPPGSMSQVFPANALQTLFDELILVGSSEYGSSAALCAKVLECLSLKINVAKAPLKGRNTLAFGSYEHCRRYMEEHFHRLRTLAQISDECHVTKCYLCRLFRRYEQESPYAYLLRLKMNQAAELLQQGNLLIKQAAEQVGFEDEFLFSRRFKSFFGVSPKEFRGGGNQQR
jgi:AraC-like DNA-binding protein